MVNRKVTIKIRTKIFEKVQILFKMVSKKCDILKHVQKIRKLHQGNKRKLRKFFCCILVGIPKVMVLLLSVSKSAPQDLVLVGQTIYFTASHQPFAVLFNTILGQFFDPCPRYFSGLRDKFFLLSFFFSYLLLKVSNFYPPMRDILVTSSYL
jgi:hypothetical protein